MATGRAPSPTLRFRTRSSFIEGLPAIVDEARGQMLWPGEGAISAAGRARSWPRRGAADRGDQRRPRPIACTMAAASLRDLDLHVACSGDKDGDARAADTAPPPAGRGRRRRRSPHPSAESDAEAAPEQAIVGQALLNRWGGYASARAGRGRAAARGRSTGAPPPDLARFRRRACRLCRRHVRHQGPRARLFLAKAAWQKLGLRGRIGRSFRPPPDAVGRRYRAAGSRALSSQGRRRGLQQRSRRGGLGDGRGVRALHRLAPRCRRDRLGRRLGRHVAGDAGDAPPADRRAEGHGLDGRVGRREALCRARRTSA